jgi:hypothetical protein
MQVVRWIIGIIIAAGIITALTLSTLQANQVECRACMTYEGREPFCSTAAAASESAARTTAIAAACASVTSGVTEVIGCQNLAPVSLQCETL